MCATETPIPFKTIPLTQGKVAIVDEHNGWLNQFNWYALLNPSNGRWYAVRNVRLPNGKYTLQRMARVIMGVTDPNIEVDHINREATLDNRESNLRLATASQNMHNQGLHKNNTSGFKGVYWDKERKRWAASIRVNGKTIHLGRFDTPEAAALAYNAAALIYHTAFAVLNDLSAAA